MRLLAARCSRRRTGPSTPILDTFTRTESPLSNGSNWVSFRKEGAAPATGATNGSVLQLAVANPSIRGALWHTVFVAGHQQVYADIIAIGSNWLELWLAEESETAGYSLELVPETAPKCKYVLLKNHTTTLATVSGEIEAGDSLWLDYVEGSGVLTAWRKHAGVWAKITEFTDSTQLKHGGRVGFAARCNTVEWQLDNFGGGGEEEGPPETKEVKTGWSTNSDQESSASAAAYALATAAYARGSHGIGASAAEVSVQATFFNAKGTSYVALATFTGTLPTTEQAKGLKAWAEALASQGVKYIEFGNETSYPYQYGETGEWFNSTQYKERAKNYTLRAKEACEALVGTGVQLLVQGEDGGSGAKTWLEEVFTAWPAIAAHSAFGGWVIHPYPNQTEYTVLKQADTQGIPKMERMVKQLREHGDTTTGICVTEWGAPSVANGRTMASGQSLNSEEAANLLEENHGKLATAAEGRLIMLLLYQPHNQQEDNGSSTEREWFFGAVTNTGGSKEVFTTFVQKWLKGEA